jgi:hypothetical protein
MTHVEQVAERGYRISQQFGGMRSLMEDITHGSRGQSASSVQGSRPLRTVEDSTQKMSWWRKREPQRRSS